MEDEQGGMGDLRSGDKGELERERGFVVVLESIEMCCAADWESVCRAIV